MAKYLQINSFRLLAFVASSLVFSACYKNEPSVLKLKVVDENNELVSGAEVHVYGQPTASPHPEVILDYELKTDASGECVLNLSDYFKPGQAGLAVVQVDVNFDDALYGEKIIKVESNKVISETIRIID